MSTVDREPADELNIRDLIARIDDLLIDTQKKQREFLAAGAALGLRLFGR